MRTSIGLGASVTVLVAAADEEVCRAAQACFEQAQHNIIVVATPEKVLAEVINHHPDLIIVDEDISTHEGICELCRDIRKTPTAEHIPLLITIEQADPEFTHQIYDSGATGFITKPVNWLLEVQKIPYRMRLSSEVTTLSESRAGWERAFNAIDDMVLIMDAGMKILWANQAAQKATNSTMDVLTGQPCYSFWEHTSSPHTACPVPQVIKTGHPQSSEIYLEDEKRTYLVTVSPVFDEAGEIATLIHTSKDITEHLEMEDHLMRAQKMQAIGTLAGGLSHDFNNLLQVILGNIQLLKLRLKDFDLGKVEIEAIIHAVHRGGDITRQLLTVSRNITSQRRPLLLNPEIEDLYSLLVGTLPKIINIELNLDRNLQMISGDAAQLSQILVNLAVNASHAMVDGGNLIIETANAVLDETYAQLHPETPAGKYVMLAVTDTGEGISTDTMEHIFEPFFTTKESGIGTGLGLAMVYGIVKNHEGSILCYSEKGEGTTFKIYFPAIKAAPEFAGGFEDGDVICGDGETILLVDDEIAIRQLGERMLTTVGYKILQASNGLEALQIYKAQTGKIDLIIMDLNMPVMGGEESVEQLRMLNPDIPIIIATGFSLSRARRDRIMAQASAFIGKPYHVNELLEEIRRALDQ